MIELKNVSKKYGSQTALNNVSLKIGQGEIIGLFGENGAGKTTLMKSILGFIRYDGEITLDGEKINRSSIGRLSFATCEHSFFPNLTPKAHADFYTEHFEAFNEKRFNGLMDFFALPMNKSLKGFSTGQKNQFEVIMALCQGADFIFMDEPFAGNDVFNREDFYKVLLGVLEPNETVLLSTHLIDEVSDFVGRAILIRSGSIVGDILLSELEDEGRSLMDYVKETYGYRADRVSKALSDISGQEDSNA
ncbi:MAG: ABC transporter ATP-binding protein [Oscillospiraceae bacterium]|nr:ABC transporter ATP-binding protein [Oscillospiraceae bacterium]